MKPVIIIPARYGSTRFPGKPLVEIKGKSMIMHVVERATLFCPDVYVATDDDRIFSHITQAGGKAIMTSPAHPSGTDRICETFEKIPGNNHFDVVVNLQGDEPFVEPAQIGQLVQLFRSDQVQIGTLAKEISNPSEINDPNRVKVVFGKDQNALYFSRAPIPFNREGKAQKYFRHIGMYAFRPEVLNAVCKLPPCELEETEKLEQLRWMWNGYNISIGITDVENIAIDSPDDLKQLL